MGQTLFVLIRKSHPSTNRNLYVHRHMMQNIFDGCENYGKFCCRILTTGVYLGVGNILDMIFDLGIKIRQNGDTNRERKDLDSRG